MEILTYRVNTCMGRISTFSGHPLSFLTDSEKDEFDKIGYSGKDRFGNKNNYTTFLNSLAKGHFSVEKIKFDNGDFCEKYLIVRVV